MSSTVYCDVVAGIPLSGGKKRWMKVGVILKFEKNDDARGPGFAVMIDKTLNPAGVPAMNNEASVMLSTFWPKEPEARPPTGERLARGAGDLDDDIPF